MLLLKGQGMPNSWSLNWEALQRGRGVTGKMSYHSIYLRVSGVYVPVAIITSPELFVTFPLLSRAALLFHRIFPHISSWLPSSPSSASAAGFKTYDRIEL